MKAYEPHWYFEPLEEVSTPAPMTAARFRYLSSIIGNGEISQSMKHATLDRRLAGKEPLRPHHPIAQAALPRLKSLENL